VDKRRDSERVVKLKKEDVLKRVTDIFKSGEKVMSVGLSIV
jgi:hypothetical protein